MNRPRRVLCFSGNLRQASTNSAILQAMQSLAPPSLALKVYGGLARLPWFSPDRETDPLPAAVRTLRRAVGAADALLIACPEYAHGVPGAFKNLLDWLVGSLEFQGKPVLLVNTSARGSWHAQDALTEILRTMSARLLAQRPFAVPLSAAGCTACHVLASAPRCAALRAMLHGLDNQLSGQSTSA